jgi:hypothetical protein
MAEIGKGVARRIGANGANGAPTVFGTINGAVLFRNLKSRADCKPKECGVHVNRGRPSNRRPVRCDNVLADRELEAEHERWANIIAAAE